MAVPAYLAMKITADCFVEITDIRAETRPGSHGSGASMKGPHATKSGYKGVYAYGRRWAAVVRENGGQQRLGTFDTSDEAARAYDAYLVAQAGGDVNAAVNFPTALDTLRDESAPFVEKFATGNLNDLDWASWQRETQGRAVPGTGPLPVLPPSAQAHANAPLINKPSTTLYRRGATPDDRDT